MGRHNSTESVLSSWMGVFVRSAQLVWPKKDRGSGDADGRELAGRVVGALGIPEERQPRPFEASNGHPGGLASIKDRLGLA